MKVRLNIDTHTFVRFWLVVIGFALAAFAIYSARTALLIIGASFFLAMALNPPVSWLAKRLPGKSRVGGTAIAFVVVVAFLAFILFLVIPPVVEQTQKFASTIPSLVNDAGKQYKGAHKLIVKYNLESQVDQIVTSVKNSAGTFASGIGTHVISGIGSFFSILTSTILILVLSFLMLVEGPLWLKKLWDVYNNEAKMEHHRTLVHKMYSVVTGYVTGQLIVSAIDGVVSGLAVFALSFYFNVPTNLSVPAAAIVFVLSLIPMFGALIGGILVASLLALNDYRAAIIFLVFFLIYQQIENNLIAPKIQSKRLDLTALAVLVAVTVGIYLFGIAGGIISIPIAGCIQVLAEDYFARAKINRIKSTKKDDDDVKGIEIREIKA